MSFSIFLLSSSKFSGWHISRWMKDHFSSAQTHICLSTVYLLVSGRRQKSDPDGSQRPV